MATSDLDGNLERMRLQLRSIAYPHPLDIQGLREGLPASFLPILHYALLGYSRHVARYLSACGYELYAKSDLRFIECTLKFLRSEFNYRCSLTLAQLFTRGFAERKLHFVHDVIQICKRKHYELLKQFRQARFMSKLKTARRSNRCELENQVPPAQPCQDEEMSELDQLSEDKRKCHNNETMCHLQGELMTTGPKTLCSTCRLTNEGDNSEKGSSPKPLLRGVLCFEKQLPGNVSKAGTITIYEQRITLLLFSAFGNPVNADGFSQSVYKQLEQVEYTALCECHVYLLSLEENHCSSWHNNGIAREALQEKLVSLEDRILHLEHHPPCEVVTAPPNIIVNYNKSFDENPSEGSRVAAAGMKDISNTHQRNSRNNCCNNLDREGLTQEFIAKVKARFNHAKKLLDGN